MVNFLITNLGTILLVLLLGLFFILHFKLMKMHKLRRLWAWTLFIWIYVPIIIFFLLPILPSWLSLRVVHRYVALNILIPPLLVLLSLFIKRIRKYWKVFFLCSADWCRASRHSLYYVFSSRSLLSSKC